MASETAICLVKNMNSSKITEFSSKEAREFFLKHSSFVNFDLPDYINFDKILRYVSIYIQDKKISVYCKNDEKPFNYEFVNYTILSNKSGAYSWRPMQIIHPVLYVNLVRLITKRENWELIQKRFLEFEQSCVSCVSIPRVSINTNSDKSSQVMFWWEKIEQESIKSSLDFNYVFITDIADCYASIYTHAFEWIFEKKGKKRVKERLKKGIKKKNLGSWIDLTIRNMTYNQTNGIPQGSTLMDFLAEIVLGYVDEELTKIIKLEKINPQAFKILRFRDDYRLFVNDPNIGHNILKLLSTVLYEMGFQLNPIKTIESNDIILSSIKSEKLERIFLSPSSQSLQKEALRVYQLSEKYPNSGLILKELSLFYDRLNKFRKSKKHEDIEVLVTIFTMIGVHSPKAISWISAIISVFLTKVDDKQKLSLIRKVHARFARIPNTGLIDIWLQRISSPQSVKITYSDMLTKVVSGDCEIISLWNSDWLDEGLVDLINQTDISSLNCQLKKKTLTSVIERSEVELFRLEYI